MTRGCRSRRDGGCVCSVASGSCRSRDTLYAGVEPSAGAEPRRSNTSGRAALEEADTSRLWQSGPSRSPSAQEQSHHLSGCRAISAYKHRAVRWRRPRLTAQSRPCCKASSPGALSEGLRVHRPQRNMAQLLATYYPGNQHQFLQHACRSIAGQTIRLKPTPNTSGGLGVSAAAASRYAPCVRPGSVGVSGDRKGSGKGRAYPRKSREAIVRVTTNEGLRKILQAASRMSEGHI